MNIIQEQNKSRILRETADRVESRSFDWSSPRRCVIGNMAQIVLGVTEDGLPSRLIGSWTERAMQPASACHESGLPMRQVLSELGAVGFSTSDIMRAEFANAENFGVWVSSDSDIADESTPAIAQRLRDWADEIDRAILREQASLSEQGGVKTVERVAQCAQR